MRLSTNQQIFLGLFVGILLGLLILFVGVESTIGAAILYVCQIAGSLFVNALKMILIPLVFLSIAVGITNLKTHAKMGAVWKITLLYFMTSTSLAIILGLFVVNIFKPGVGLSSQLFQTEMSTVIIERLTLSQFFESFLSQLFTNPIAAMAAGNVLPTVMFAIILGIALVVAQERTKSIQNILNEGFEIMMQIVGWIMWIAPYGIAGLIAKLVATQNADLLSKLGIFIVIVVGATIFHGLVTLPALLKIITGMSPLRFFHGMRESLITAFSTSSSSATMPVTLRCVQDNLKVDKSISGFVVPLGTTVNMDGTALYEAVAALFVANLVGIELNLVQQITVFFMAMIVSIGAPGIPSAGMVTMIMVLQSVGLPVEAIGILLPIDRPLDAIRTMVNVEGDAICSVVVQKVTER